MKGAEFYERGRIYRCRPGWERRRRWKRGSREVWVEFGGGRERGEREKEERNMKRDKTKKGSTRLNRPTLEKLAATCQPLLDLMYLIFHRFSTLEPSSSWLERNERETTSWKASYSFSIENQGRNLDWNWHFARDSRILNSHSGEIFFSLRKRDSNISNST